jgi:hypothetical protein
VAACWTDWGGGGRPGRLGRSGPSGSVGPESRIQIGLPEKNRKGLWNFSCKIEFESR